MVAQPTPGSSGPQPSLDRRAELTEFLRNRRSRLKPADVGLPDFGRRRRVPGLRREELAQLAGVSVAYYTRLEQGGGNNVSTEVLDSIARALRLTETEHAHLVHLARPKSQRRRPPARAQQLRSPVRSLLDSLETVPAYAIGRRTEILGWNRLAAALFGDWSALEPAERNWARLTFFAESTRDLFVDWEDKAADVVALLRVEAGYSPDDPQLAALVGELSVRSAEFRRFWAVHDVKQKCHGSKRLRHPLVGSMTLYCESFRLADDPDQALVTYHAEPGSPSAEALRLLASWGVDATTAPTG